jgi:hypothetical protein
MALAFGFLWTLPNTIIGLLLGLLTFQRPRLAGGALLFDHRARGVTVLLRKIGRSAMTIGFVILGTRPVEGRLLVHEKHHILQYMWLGPLFLPVYGVLALRYGYKRHPFELAAKRASGELPGAVSERSTGPSSPDGGGPGPAGGPA